MNKYISAIGRRKTATAKARIYEGKDVALVDGKPLEKGMIYVNGMPIAKYFSDAYSKMQYEELLRCTNSTNRITVTVLVSGSGMSGQLGATTLAIARALVKSDPKLQPILRKKGYMTRDPRAKERKKPGLMGARKQKSSPKR